MVLVRRYKSKTGLRGKYRNQVFSYSFQGSSCITRYSEATWQDNLRTGALRPIDREGNALTN